MLTLTAKLTGDIGSTVVDYIKVVWEFVCVIATSGWGYAAATMEVMEQAASRLDKVTSQAWWARALRWTLGFAKRIHPRWLAATCLFVAAFLAWHEQKERAATAENTVAADQVVEKTDKERIGRLRDLLAEAEIKHRAATLPSVTSYNQSGGITAGVVNVGAPKRFLSPEKARAFMDGIEHLVKKGTRIPVTSNTSQEAKVFATEIVATLRAAGMTSDLQLPIPELRPEITGILIGIRDPNQVPPEVAGLIYAFRKAEFQVSTAQMEPTFFPSESFVVVIGAHP